ncbi:MAG TPA: SEC-C metal-binding domain-containing protein, partial [Acidobacteriaceae bacterium]|nr:SEC-C metal-binding domain-containing protein [Acidobacteriaceae bacterium]
YRKDKQYAVMRHPESGELSIIIIDEFTGRLMIGRQWSDGLHQAVEAKHARDGVKIKEETQTLATITLQNYFKLYKKLAGMTGTAMTEANEFWKIYKLDVIAIPTNRPLIRINHADVIFRTEKEKWSAVVEEIVDVHRGGRPMLIGTTDVDKSIKLSGMLKRRGVKHELLNALPEHAAREAEIVAQAGRIGSVTIATNMAGRGTDILLGGNPEFIARQDLVKRNLARALSPAEGAIHPNAAPGFTRFYYQGQEFETTQEQWNEIIAAHESATKIEHDKVVEVGGLFILGTERHESRRVDNQLRGRAGRQGDPGASRFFLSLEDDLMRIFAREWVGTLLQKLGMEEGVPIESRMISKRIEGAQKAVEAQNFESRKHVLEYDDVMNKQREAVYGLRRQLMEGVEQKELITDDYVSTILSNLIDEFVPEKAHVEQWNLEGLFNGIFDIFGAKLQDQINAEELSRHDLGEAIFTKLQERYNVKEQILGPPNMRYHERVVMLSVLDGLWKDHLLNMDHLKEGIGLRGYAQVDPLVEYKKESFTMFEAMMMRFQEDTCRHLFRMQILAPDGTPIETMEQLATLQARHFAAPPQTPPPAQMPTPSQTNWQRPGANGATASGPPPVVPTKAPQTTIDALEREFARKKERELEIARQAGGSTSNGNGSSPKRTGQNIGRNDPCYCGSGKKYKKCHGANV